MMVMILFQLIQSDFNQFKEEKFQFKIIILIQVWFTHEKESLKLHQITDSVVKKIHQTQILFMVLKKIDCCLISKPYKCVKNARDLSSFKITVAWISNRRQRPLALFFRNFFLSRGVNFENSQII
jgi:transposase-like protein